MAWFERCKFTDYQEFCKLKQENKELKAELELYKTNYQRVTGYGLNQFSSTHTHFRPWETEEFQIKEELNQARIELRNINTKHLHEIHDLKKEHTGRIKELYNDLKEEYCKNRELENKLYKIEKELKMYKEFFEGNRVEVVLGKKEELKFQTEKQN